MGYGDYLEQLTYPLFLKMADDYSKPPLFHKMPLPAVYNWETPTTKKEYGTGDNTYLRELAR